MDLSRIYPVYPTIPNNKSFMLSLGEALPFKRPLPHPLTPFGRILQVNGVDVGIYPDLPHLPQIINYLC